MHFLSRSAHLYRRLSHLGKIRQNFSDQPPNNNRPKPTLNRQQLQKAHDEITQQMLNKEDQTSYQNQNINKNHFLIGGLFAVAVGGLWSILQYWARGRKAQQENDLMEGKDSLDSDLGIGCNWVLEDLNGRRFGSKNLAGGYYVVYFGFCRCPDVCPSYLYRITQAFDLIKKTPEAQFFKLKNVFVSIDPDKDTPQVMKQFLANFDSSIIGLRGSSNNDPDLIDMMQGFKVTRNKVYSNEIAEKSDNYLIDHTNFAYLMTEDNHLLSILGPNLNGRETAKLIMTKIQDRETKKFKLLRSKSEDALRKSQAKKAAEGK